jgi:bacterioferritin-associated ferredoxin
MVTKCVCSDILFSEMKVTADKYDLRSVNELKEYVNIGENCQFCIPYIEKMLKTGETEFKPEFE